MDFQIVPMERGHLDQVEALERLCFPEDPVSYTHLTLPTILLV